MLDILRFLLFLYRELDGCDSFALLVILFLDVFEGPLELLVVTLFSEFLLRQFRRGIARLLVIDIERHHFLKRPSLLFDRERLEALLLLG